MCSLQFGSGVLHGLGGESPTNAINAAVTLSLSAVVSRAITGPTPVGYRTVSKRADDRYLKNAATSFGVASDVIAGFFEGPVQVQIPNEP